MSKKSKTPAPASKRRVKLPGRQKFKSLRDAVDHVAETLGMLHNQAHAQMRNRR
jgi:hypothetical protein